MVGALPVAAPVRCSMCGGLSHVHVADYGRPPKGETEFGIADYRRTLWRCEACGHVVNRHGFDLVERLYQGAYADATYGDAMRRNFDRIMALPAERSDNRQRVRRIEAYVATTGLAGRSLLDVGSGLGVFPAAMKDAGWNCAALDPDPRAIALVRDAAGVEGICGDFMQLVPSGRFHLVTFNKVLEHVPDPASMLTRSSDWLSPGGTVYVELPDGEGAIAEGPGREEFLVEHYHAFSATSVTLLARHAGFSSRVVERVREPSGKFTLYAFLTRSQ